MTVSGSVPQGWRSVRFGDVAREVREATRDPEADGLNRVVGLDHLDSGDLRLNRWDELTDRPDGTSFTRIFRAGQVLFGKRRAYQRKVAVPDFDGICSGDILVFEPSSDVVLPDYLPHLVQSDGFFEHALGTSAGSLSPRTKWQDLARYAFLLPPPAVQASVVQVLETARSAVERYREVLTAIQEQRESLLDELTARVGNGFVALGDVADVVSGESWSAEDESTTPSKDAVPVIGIPALKADGTIRIETQAYVRGLASKRSLFTTDGLTLLVIRTNGNADRIGNVYRLDDDLSGRALGAFIFGCRFRTALQRDVAFEYMRGSRFQRWATSLVAGTTGLKNLPIRELRRMAVPDASSAVSLVYLERLAALRTLEERTSEALQSGQALAVGLREGLMRPPRAE
jgi:type I restriction enzyme S subunit